MTGNNVESISKEHPRVEFISPDDMSLKLIIIGYEFKEATEDFFDKNWYNVEIVLTGKNLSAKLAGAFLLATEVKFLLDEFRKIENGESDRFLLEPIEPYFEFNIISDDTGLLKINGFVMPEDKNTFENKVNFSFHIPKDNIHTIIANLENALQEFPVRD